MAVEHWVELPDQLTLSGMGWLASTYELDDSISMRLRPKITYRLAQFPVFVLSQCTADMLLDPYTQGPLDLSSAYSDTDVLCLGYCIGDAVDDMFSVLSAAAFFSVHNTYYRRSSPKCQPFFVVFLQHFTACCTAKFVALHKN